MKRISNIKGKMYRKTYFWINLIASIVFITISLIIIFSNIIPPNDNLPFSVYHFDIYSSSNDGFINNFGLNYDFEKGNGNLSFDFFSEVPKLDRIIISMPPELKVSSFLVKDEEGINLSSFCYGLSGASTGISCDNIIGNKTLNILLNLKNVNFYPNGAFIFNFPSHNTYSKFYMDTWSGDLIRFNLGNYRCGEKCFSDEKLNSNLTYNSDKNFFRVYFIPTSDKKVGDWYGFIINTYDFYKEKWVGFKLAFGISLLSGSIFFLFNFIREQLKRKTIV